VVFGLGDGVFVRNTSLVSATQALLTVDVSSSAALGGHLVSANNVDGASFTSAGPMFTVLDGISVASITPSSGTQGSTVAVTIIGSGLLTVNTPAEILFSGAGLTAGNIVATASSLAFDLTISPVAEFGLPRDLTLQRDNGAQLVVSAAFAVLPTPVITGITPSTVISGEQGLAVTVNGTGFDPGAVVTNNPGVVVVTQTVVDSTQIDITLDVTGLGGTGSALFVANPDGSLSAAEPLAIVAPNPLLVSSGVLQISNANALSYDSITVSGGELRIVGDITVNVVNDVNVTGGAIVFDSDLSFGRLRVGGNLLVDALGVVNADGNGELGGEPGTAGLGLGGGARAGQASLPGGQGGGYGGRGGAGVNGVGGATYDMLGLCTPPACFAGMPLNLGSGGGSGFEWPASGTTGFWRAGGNGGGAFVLDVAGNVTVNGLLSANGFNGIDAPSFTTTGLSRTTKFGVGSGGGSGGAILVLAGGTFGGTVGGRIESSGGTASPFTASAIARSGTGGGGGRVAVYYGVANSFAGALACDGGTSNYTAAAYTGDPGTCLLAPMTTVSTLNPNSVARGGSISPVIAGAGVVVNDTVLFSEPTLTGGLISQPAADLIVPITASENTPLGTHDVFVRHADETGGVAFGALTVAANPTVLRMVPNRLVDGVTSPVSLEGSLLDAAGSQVSFLRNGVLAPLTATVDTPTSGPGQLSLQVTVPAGTATGGYDVMVVNPNGGSDTLHNGFIVTAAAGDVPAPSALAPAVVPAGAVDFPVTVFGYDFGVPGAFPLPTLSSAPPNDTAVTFQLDPAGCPGPANEAACEPSAGVLQYIDVLVTTTGAVGGELVDVIVTQGAVSGMLPGGMSISEAPSISALNPTAAVGSFTLTVSGTGFQAGATVTIDNANISVGPTIASGADLTVAVVIPVDLATVDTVVRVTNLDGGAAVSVLWTINPTPVVSSLSPIDTVTPGQSSTIDIVGDFFHPNASVSFGAGVAVSAPVFVSVNTLQVVVSVDEAAEPGPRTVTVSNHVSRVPGELIDGFTVGRQLIFQSVTPNEVGVGAGTESVLLFQTAGFVTKAEGFSLLVAGQEFSSSMKLGDISFSNSDVELLNRDHDVFSSSDLASKTSLTNFRSTSIPGGPTVTSASFMIKVEHGTSTGPGTLALDNPDGSSGSVAFTINPAPVISMVEPNTVTQGDVISLAIHGFGFDPVDPQVCFGDDCTFSADEDGVTVLDIRPQHPNRVDVTIKVSNSSVPSSISVKVLNPDGGRATESGALHLVSSFSVSDGGIEVAPGGTTPTTALTGSGFENTPATPQLSFLLADGAVDTNLSAVVDGPSVSATSLNYTVSATAAAAPGWRTLAMVNGDGAYLEKDGFLLVTQSTGPTIGGLSVPDGASGFRSAVVGQAAWYDRVIRGVLLHGSGLTAAGLILSFDDPAIAVTNLSVIDGATVSFDLTLGASTVPGPIGLTITTTASGGDVRAGVLTVVTAPLVTRLSPSHLTQGVSNVSVMATGAGFDPDMDAVLCRAMVIPGSAVGVRHSIAASGFVPSAATVELLLPSGAVDAAITNGTAAVSANQPDVIDVVFDVGAAAPGLRSLRITNGTGGVLTVPDVLVITGVVDSGIGTQIDVDASACNPEIVAAGSTGNTRTVTGEGFAETPSAIGAQFLLPNGAVDSEISATVSPLLGDTTRVEVSVDVSGAASTGYRTLRLTNGDGAVLAVPDYLLVTPTGTINGAGNVPFISLRDFDSDRAGNQVSWFGSTLLRTVADVGVLASGDYYLQLTGSNGGVVRHLLPVPISGFGTPAKLAYLTGIGTDGLHVRDWLGTSPVQPPLKSDPFGGAELPHNGSRNDLWTVLRSNPMNPGEYTLAIGQANTLTVPGSRVTLYNLQPGNPSWVEVGAVGALESGLAQGFDVAYEHAANGRGLMVYGFGNALWMKRLNGAAPATTEVVAVAGDPSLATSGRPIWVRLIPQRQTQRILVMYQTDTHELHALIWDGAAANGNGAFISQYDGLGAGPLPGSAPPPIVSWGVRKRGFDGAWESTSGRAVAFYGVDGGNGVHAVTWDPLSGAWGADSTSVPLSTGTGPVFLEAEAAPEGDRIAVLTSIPQGGERALAYHFYNNGWEGLDGHLNLKSAFINAALPVVDRNFDMGWDDRGRLIALYTTRFISTGSAGYVAKLDTRVWDPANILEPENGWGVSVEQPLTHPTGNASANPIIPVYLDISEDPDSGELLALVVDEGGIEGQPAADALTTQLLRWNGFGWTDRTLLDSDMGHWAEKSADGGKRARIYGDTARVTYQDDLLPPQAVTLSPTGVAGASSVEVKWTTPGDNGISGQAGGYDIRWAPVDIVDDASVADCALLTTQICFSDANQVANPPLPGASGDVQTLSIDFGTSGVFWVAVKTGDRASRMGTGGEIIPWRNVSAMSNSLLVTPLASDTITPEAITDLAALPGANTESMAVLTWSGVGDDGGVPSSPPVLGYDVRISTLNISEVGGNTNFFVPFDQVTRSEVVAPASLLGNTRGVLNSYTVTGLDPSTEYFFAVKGLDEDPTQYAPISNVVSLTTAKLTPTPVDDLIVASSTTNSVTLAWTARGGGPTSYDMRFGVDTIVDDFASVVDCANLPAGQICMSRAARVLNTPVPAADGVRQSVLVQGLAPATTYHFALVPVLYQNVAGIFTRVAPAVAAVSLTTLADPDGTLVQPSAVNDFQLVSGSVRTHEGGLRWTAPNAPDNHAGRYEVLWATRPLSSAPAADIHAVWVPLLPGVSGVLQEFTLRDLPENAVLHVALRSYSVNGVASTLSNEVELHTAMRLGVNAISIPGSLFNDDINTLLGSVVGTCPSSGLPVTGTGPVGACANGETPQVAAFRWDPAVGPSGDFVAIDVTDATPDPLAPGEGIFLFASGTQAILDGLEGFDLASFGNVAIPSANAALVANPFRLPVAVADLRIIGVDGLGAEVYNQAFTVAASGGVVNTELEFYTEVNSVVTRVPVTVTDDLLPYRAYFIQLGGTPDPALNYFVEVPHP
jgi:hypothetical protein